MEILGSFFLTSMPCDGKKMDICYSFKRMYVDLLDEKVKL